MGEMYHWCYKWNPKIKTSIFRKIYRVFRFLDHLFILLKNSQMEFLK